MEFPLKNKRSGLAAPLSHPLPSRAIARQAHPTETIRTKGGSVRRLCSHIAVFSRIEVTRVQGPASTGRVSVRRLHCQDKGA